MSMIFSGKAKEHYSQLNNRELPEADKLLSATIIRFYIGDEMAEKLILPAEIKVCATCSYWDGERQIDGEMKVVVVSDDCSGECLVQESQKHALQDVRKECSCIWEDLEPDAAEEVPKP